MKTLQQLARQAIIKYGLFKKAEARLGAQNPAFIDLSTIRKHYYYKQLIDHFTGKIPSYLLDRRKSWQKIMDFILNSCNSEAEVKYIMLVTASSVMLATGQLYEKTNYRFYIDTFTKYTAVIQQHEPLFQVPSGNFKGAKYDEGDRWIKLYMSELDTLEKNIAGSHVSDLPEKKDLLAVIDHLRVYLSQSFATEKLEEVIAGLENNETPNNENMNDTMSL